MIIQRRFSVGQILAFAAPSLLLSLLWSLTIFALYAYGELHFLRLPFLPISTVGTAVAFYVGFKNNAAYERFWEGRTIWGGIVNTSRCWAAAVMSYVAVDDPSAEAHALRRTLIYRQLAWANAVRLQLRKVSRFHHKPARATKRRLEAHGDVMRNDWEAELAPLLGREELAEVTAMVNPATHLLSRQAQELARLVKGSKLDLFHQIALMEKVTECYEHQGKCERIKGTPFPRQYAEYSRVFTRTFVALVPLGLLDVFGAQVDKAVGVLETITPALPMVLASMLISWVFMTIEAIGDASEDPFERSMNDVPMNAICRTIERDLRQLLGEEEVPEGEKPAGWILY
jgi:putative membrane protein